MLSENTPDECEDEWIQNNADFKWLWMVSSVTASDNPAQSFHVKNGSLVRKTEWIFLLSLVYKSENISLQESNIRKYRIYHVWFNTLKLPSNNSNILGEPYGYVISMNNIFSLNSLNYIERVAIANINPFTRCNETIEWPAFPGFRSNTYFTVSIFQLRSYGTG